ncbi:MAG: galactose oxidase early set domain-containing protein [Enhygromyxa sp.]
MVDGAPRPSISFGSPGDVSTGNKPLLPYGGTLDAQGTVRGGSTISRFTLIRLGSTTHGFDQDQRFLELSFTQSNGIYSVQGPESANEAPPGYYMLFAISGLGEPSVGQYVQVGANE